MQKTDRECCSAWRNWPYRIRAGLAGIALAGMAAFASADVTVCVEPGEALALRVQFEASFENAVVVSGRAGQRVASFNNFFGRGAGGEWESGANTWQSPRLVARDCFRISGLHKAGAADPALPWLPSACRVTGRFIGFEDGGTGNDRDYNDARVEILSGRIAAVDPPCQALAAARPDDDRMNVYKWTKPPAAANGSPPASAAPTAPAAPAAKNGGEARPPAIARDGVAGNGRSPGLGGGAGFSGGQPGTTLSFKLPEFPFPPPDPSARLRIPYGPLTGNAASPTFGSVAARMENALASNGYTEVSYFAVPGGFALVTQLERINPDATPAAEQRWNIAVAPVSLRSFSLEAYVQALLQKDAGYFRVITFVFSSEPFTASGKKVPVDEAANWIDKGANALPRDVAARPYGEDMVCTALVYEFEIHTHGAAAQLRKPSPHDGAGHLRASGILRALGE